MKCKMKGCKLKPLALGTISLNHCWDHHMEKVKEWQKENDLEIYEAMERIENRGSTSSIVFPWTDSRYR